MLCGNVFNIFDFTIHISSEKSNTCLARLETIFKCTGEYFTDSKIIPHFCQFYHFEILPRGYEPSSCLDSSMYFCGIVYFIGTIACYWNLHLYVFECLENCRVICNHIFTSFAWFYNSFLYFTPHKGFI